MLNAEAQTHDVHRVRCIDEIDIAVGLSEAHRIFR